MDELTIWEQHTITLNKVSGCFSHPDDEESVINEEKNTNEYEKCFAAVLSCCFAFWLLPWKQAGWVVVSVFIKAIVMNPGSKVDRVSDI